MTSIDDFISVHSKKRQKQQAFDDRGETVAVMSRAIQADAANIARVCNDESWIFMKLFLGMPKSELQLVLSTAGTQVNLSEMYATIGHLCDFGTVHNIVGNVDADPENRLNGACIGDVVRYFDWIVGYYSDLNMFLADEYFYHNQLLCPFWIDGRMVWGKNEAVGLCFRNVALVQSPRHVWPLMFLKSPRAESFDVLQTVQATVGFNSWRTSLHNRVSSNIFFCAPCQI